MFSRAAPDEAVKANIFAAGTTMLSIIGGSNKRGTANMVVKVEGAERTIRSYAKDLDEVSRSYGMPAPLVARHRRKMENLDEDLKDLVARCCAAAPGDRPNLEDLIGQVEHHVATKTEADYAGKQYSDQESDEYITRIVKDMIINAKTDVEEADSESSLFSMPSTIDPPLDPFGPPYGGFGGPRPPPRPGGFGGGEGFGAFGPSAGGGFGPPEGGNPGSPGLGGFGTLGGGDSRPPRDDTFDSPGFGAFGPRAGGGSGKPGSGNPGSSGLGDLGPLGGGGDARPSRDETSGPPGFGGFWRPPGGGFE